MDNLELDRAFRSDKAKKCTDCWYLMIYELIEEIGRCLHKISSSALILCLVQQLHVTSQSIP
jgi:hypothetical protein